MTHIDMPVRRFVLTSDRGVVTADGVVWPDGLMFLRSRADTAYSVHPGGIYSLPREMHDFLLWVDEE